jgi:hypothetical protein
MNSSSWLRGHCRSCWLAAAAAVALLTPGPTPAQRLEPGIPPVGTQVRVLLKDSTHTHGRLIEATADALSVRRLVGANNVKVVDRTIPRDSVLET